MRLFNLLDAAGSRHGALLPLHAGLRARRHRGGTGERPCGHPDFLRRRRVLAAGIRDRLGYLGHARRAASRRGGWPHRRIAAVDRRQLHGAVRGGGRAVRGRRRIGQRRRARLPRASARGSPDWPANRLSVRQPRDARGTAQGPVRSDPKGRRGNLLRQRDPHLPALAGPRGRGGLALAIALAPAGRIRDPDRRQAAGLFAQDASQDPRAVVCDRRAGRQRCRGRARDRCAMVGRGGRRSVRCAHRERGAALASTTACRLRAGSSRSTSLRQPCPTPSSTAITTPGPTGSSSARAGGRATGVADQRCAVGFRPGSAGWLGCWNCRRIGRDRCTPSGALPRYAWVHSWPDPVSGRTAPASPNSARVSSQ
jgi:hypothetical protein